MELGVLKETHGNWSSESLGLRVFHEKVCEDSFSEELRVCLAWWVCGGGRVRG